MVGMRKTRIGAVLLAGFAVTVGGCSSAGGGAQQGAPEPALNVLASVDPCQVLGEQDLQALGVSAPGEPLDQGIGEKACEFSGDALDLSVVKGEQSSLAYWEGRRSNMAVFETNKVGQRDGAKMISTASVGNGVCSQAIFVGQGSVSIQVTTSSASYQNDEATCAKAMEIAQVAEKKLPK
ncbi:DUF3558 domain-containing protein [Saccharopolyspora karakumensis]|uniref:DUF3558 domain-containing protein n=1 Tax=Saccharopolyspora karakumensis TaxID=2530386 RepID=A0A4R5BVJ1_9PSEU|nr:DUF3558 family protein [Saccharopolyspora karakumensis]TDD89736.1 DUF3558 domain-containing protein [Saccharopolyspora karakumensis]